MFREIFTGTNKRKRWLRWIGLGIGGVVGGGLIYLSIKDVDLDLTLSILGRINWVHAILATLILVLSPVLFAWRWRELFVKNKPNFVRLIGAVVTGRTVNVAIPFGAGEVARVLVVGDIARSVGTVVFERTLDAGFFIATVLLLPLIWVVPGSLRGPLDSTLAIMGVFVFLVLCAVFLIHYKPEMFKKVSLPPLNRLPLLLALSLCIVASNILVNYLILLALNIQASFLISLVLMVVFQVGLAVPSSPGKVGVFQYLSVVTLGLFGIEKAQGLAFGLVWHLLIFIPFALLAALFWFFRDHFPRPTIAKEDMYVETG